MARSTGSGAVEAIQRQVCRVRRRRNLRVLQRALYLLIAVGTGGATALVLLALSASPRLFARAVAAVAAATLGAVLVIVRDAGRRWMRADRAPRPARGAGRGRERPHPPRAGRGPRAAPEAPSAGGGRRRGLGAGARRCRSFSRTAGRRRGHRRDAGRGSGRRAGGGRSAGAHPARALGRTRAGLVRTRQAQCARARGGTRRRRR
ncbi:MAG: hypothetical protein E6J68_12295 [Deltaproteobacteria bacterium]|nr:MAG: hypothetical protein E6J68_12295 [Deltaproteobacteria bacterium]